MVMKIVVTDGNNRVALAVIRALGIAGAEITCTEQSPFARRTPISFASKFVRKKIITPAPTEQDFIPAMLAIAKKNDVLLPVSTNLVLAIVKHKELFEKNGVHLPFADIDTITSVNDKLFLVQKAQALQIPVPQTYAPAELNEAIKLSENLHYPAVLKLRSDESLYLAPQQRYSIVHSSENLAKEYKRLASLKKSPLIQEYIPGNGYGFFCLMDTHSNPIAIFCHRRLREYPISGGPATLCESVYVKEMIDYGLRLLQSLRWSGIAMVEFRKSSDDGKFYLMEVNPRYWGSLPLATLCNVNFPLLHCRWALGEKIQQALKYKTNVKLRFVFTDLLNIYERFITQTNIGDFFDDILGYPYGEGVRDGILDKSDPRPGLLYIKNRFLCVF